MFVNHHTSSDIERWRCYLLPSLPSVRVDGAVSRVLVENEKIKKGILVNFGSWGTKITKDRFSHLLTFFYKTLIRLTPTS